MSKEAQGRLYRVRDVVDSEVYLVSAKSQAAAIKALTEGRFKVDIPSPLEAAKLAAGGTPVSSEPIDGDLFDASRPVIIKCKSDAGDLAAVES